MLPHPIGRPTDRVNQLKSDPFSLIDNRQACVEVGFLYVTNTGVPAQTSQKALELGRRFFSLPQARVSG